MNRLLPLSLCAALATPLAPARAAEEAPYASLEDWGRALFFDVNLSQNRSQACATCHDPEAGFAFYARLFGWTKGRAMDMGEMGTYQLIQRNGQDIGAIQHRAGVGLHRGPGLGVVGVGNGRADPRPGLDRDSRAERDQLLHRLRRYGAARLAFTAFAGHGDGDSQANPSLIPQP